MKNEKVGSQLLEKGQLQKTMILISLNKIQAGRGKINNKYCDAKTS